MKDNYLKPAMRELRPALSEVVTTLESKSPYGAVSLLSRETTQYLVDNSQERVISGDPTAGAVLTVFDGSTQYEKSLGGFNLAEIQAGARDLISGVDFKPNGKIDPGKQTRQDFQTEMKKDPALVSTQDKLDILRELNRRVNKIDSRIVNARVGFAEINEKNLFRNRALDLAQDITRVTMGVWILVMGEKGVVYDRIIKCGTAGMEILTFSDEELEKLVRNTIKLLDAERIEPGEYDVVTSPGVSGLICHESFGHGVETDMFLKERAKAAHYIGKRVGSDLVNIFDDPSYPGGFGSYFFDDEGLEARPTQIVKDGIFQRGITDSYSASLLGIERSPNGRRQDFTRKVYPRMTNTFFGSGETSPDDLLAMVDEGIYIPQWSSGMEDPKGWGIQATGQYGFLIKGGQITEKMYAPVGITGYVPEVLNSITAVANDFDLEGGTCGKGTKEYVPTTSGGPHLLMKVRLG